MTTGFEWPDPLSGKSTNRPVKQKKWTAVAEACLPLDIQSKSLIKRGGCFVFNERIRVITMLITLAMNMPFLSLLAVANCQQSSYHALQATQSEDQ